MNQKYNIDINKISELNLDIKYESKDLQCKSGYIELLNKINNIKKINSDSFYITIFLKPDIETIRLLSNIRNNILIYENNKNYYVISNSNLYYITNILNDYSCRFYIKDITIEENINILQEDVGIINIRKGSLNDRRTYKNNLFLKIFQNLKRLFKKDRRNN